MEGEGQRGKVEGERRREGIGGGREEEKEEEEWEEKEKKERKERSGRGG